MELKTSPSTLAKWWWLKNWRIIEQSYKVPHCPFNKLISHPSSVTVSPHTPRPFLKLAPSHFVDILTCLLLDSGVVEVCGVIRWMKGGDFLSLCTVSNWSSRKTRRFLSIVQIVARGEKCKKADWKIAGKPAVCLFAVQSTCMDCTYMELRPPRAQIHRHWSTDGGNCHTHQGRFRLRCIKTWTGGANDP